ncbi:MAG: hypothetical protein KAF91_12600 [Nostoc sp. TH1S01]|nr:hypothetical protein [Nostoc sp. TH1S01]
MIISDLNYLEVATEEVVGGGFDFDVSQTVFIDVTVNETVDITKHVDVSVSLDDNLATAEASANAEGRRSLAETFTATYTNSVYSAANSYSVSATDDFFI